jgi:hypothetical protein
MPLHTHRRPPVRAAHRSSIEPLEVRRLLTGTAAAQLALLSTTGTPSAPVYNYDITLTNTGSTPISTFWFGWAPGEDFLPSRPSATSDPTGWADALTGAGNSTDGTAIEWTTHTAALRGGGSLSGFDFSTADSPAVLAGTSPAHVGTPATTSFVYAGAPLSDAGFMFVAAVPTTPTPTPTPTATPVATTTTLAASAASVTAGTSVTFTATVAPTTPTVPTGSVTFLDNGASIGTGTVGADGTATLATTTLPVGSDVVTASYGGDATDAPSTSAAVTETVTAATPSPAESASAQVSLVSLSGTPAAPVYNYDITLTDTGTTPIGTFWFAWTPGQNFLPTVPTAESSPTGWGNDAGTSSTPDLTGPEGSPDGTAVRWVAQSAGALLAPGQSLGGFDFSSTDAPAALAGLSPTHPTVPVGTSFVYSGAPFSDAGAEFTAAVTAPAVLPHLEPSLDASKLPTQVVAGAAVNIAVPVTVTNFAKTAATGRSTVTLFAAPDGRLDGTQTSLVAVSRSLAVRADGSATVSLRLRKIPASLSNAGYTLIATVTDANGATLASTAAATLAVAPATVALAATVAPQSTAPTNAGRTATLTVTVANDGNVSSSGPLAVTLGLSLDGATVAVPLGTTRHGVTLKPGGKPVVLHLRVRIPAAAAAGTDRPLVSVVQGNASVTAVGTTPVTVDVA